MNDYINKSGRFAAGRKAVPTIAIATFIVVNIPIVWQRLLKSNSTAESPTHDERFF
ncbi:MAG: hypothetical protein ACKVJX_07590 [Verrucomicrobiia bacterium]|jgi:hypothetical protein